MISYKLICTMTLVSTILNDNYSEFYLFMVYVHIVVGQCFQSLSHLSGYNHQPTGVGCLGITDMALSEHVVPLNPQV